MRSRIRAVLFDVDDTLFDRQRAQQVTLRLIVQERPDLFAGLDRGRLRQAFAESDRIACQEHDAGMLTEGYRDRRSALFLQLLGLDETPAPEISSLYVARYPLIDAPVPGARAVVKELAAGFRLGIVSNSFPDVQYRKLEALQIRRFFDCVVLSEEVGISKPHPGIFWRAASALAVDPKSCLHVGDSFATDVVGAKRAGMAACWFNPQGLPRPPGDVTADLEIRELRSLVPRLAEMGGRP